MVRMVRMVRMVLSDTNGANGQNGENGTSRHFWLSPVKLVSLVNMRVSSILDGLVVYCFIFFSFSVHFAYLIIFELNFFSLQSNRSLCQGSGVKTTAAVVFTPQLRSSG